MSMTSITKIYHMIQIILQMCSCQQSLVTLSFLWDERSYHNLNLKQKNKKPAFFEGWTWFKFNNLGLTPDTNVKFYTSGAKRLRLKVRKLWELIPTFVYVTRKKLVGGTCSVLEAIHCQFEGQARRYKMERENTAEISILRNSRKLFTRHRVWWIK